MGFWYTPAKERLAKGDFDWDEAAHDVRLLLCMSNTTADTDQDAATLSAITTLDEYDGAGYSPAALASQTVTRDDANNRVELGASSPVSFGSTVAAGTRNVVGAIVYRHVDGTAANDLPIAWLDNGGSPFAVNGGGGAFTLTIDAEGLLQVT